MWYFTRMSFQQVLYKTNNSESGVHRSFFSLVYDPERFLRHLGFISLVSSLPPDLG